MDIKRYKFFNIQDECEDFDFVYVRCFDGDPSYGV